MPLTFRKSFRVLPGVKLNINLRSWSWTIGSRSGAQYTRSSTGRRTWSFNIPGPWGYRHTTTANQRRNRRNRRRED